MKKYLKDMEASELMQVIAHNSTLEAKLTDLALDNAQDCIDEYLFGLREGGADYRIGFGDRGGFFVICEDDQTIYRRYEYTKFRTWLDDVRKMYGFLDSDEAHEIIGEFLDQADVCWDNFYVCDCTEEEMEKADSLLFEKRVDAGWYIFNQLMKEYDGVFTDNSCLLDFIYEAFDADTFDAAYVNMEFTDNWDICIDVPEIVIPEHTEVIF